MQTKFKITRNTLLFFIILSTILYGTIGCKRDSKKPINTTKELQSNMYFQKYVEAFVAYSESITNDEWDLSNPKVKNEWMIARNNHALDSFTKRLMNKKGESYYSKRLKVMQAYTNVYINLIRPGIITKEMFDQTFAISIKYK